MRGIALLLVFLLFSASAFSQSVISTSAVESDEHFSSPTAVNGKLFFVVQHSNDPDGGAALWKTDVNRTDAVLVKNFRGVRGLVNYRGTLFFVANDDLTGDELWKTNGTAEGTIRVKDIRPGVDGSTIKGFSVANGVLYFTAIDGVHGRELWKSNGTTTGTSMVKDIMRVSGSSNPTSLVNLNGTLFFSANDGVNGYELWRTDGSSAGTRLVKDLRPGFKVSSTPTNLINKNGLLIFTALGSTTGRELWRSDGTTGGTFLLKDVRQGTLSSHASNFTLVDTTLYFAANDGIHGLELWKSDGTASGTKLFVDLTPGPGSNTGYTTPHLAELTAVNHKLYFLAVTPGPGIYEYSQSLWVSDGTETGTRRLTLIPNVSFSFIIAYITEFKHAAFFVAASEQMGLDLWRSNGTVNNTVRVIRDVAESYSYLVRPTKVRNYLYYIGHENLNRTDGTAAGALVISGIEATPEWGVPSGEVDVPLSDIPSRLSVFPNPFNSEFELAFGGEDNVGYALKVVDANGVTINSFESLGGSTYALGSEWRPGLYVIQVTTRNETFIKRIFKSK